MNDKNETSIPFCVSGMMMTSQQYVFDDSSNGMIMYMDGFRLSLQRQAPCLNLYFEEWTLDTEGKFWLAMLGICALGILTEAVSKLRFMLNKRSWTSYYRKRWCITVLHGLQAFLGYTLMLATMTFSVELLCCVILGLAVGFYIFYDDNGTHVTANPCCYFIQEEFYERASTLQRQISEQEHQEQENEDAAKQRQEEDELAIIEEQDDEFVE